MKKEGSRFEAVVIGVSAGGLNALSVILAELPPGFKLPVIIVQHIHPSSDYYMVCLLDDKAGLTVKEAQDKEDIVAKTVYFAPPDYHLLIENDRTFSLSIEDRVNFTRPSIDVLFESASDVYGSGLIGIILTGANQDGSYGLKVIKERGGVAVVQDPETAESDFMPRAALRVVNADYIIPLNQIAQLLVKLVAEPE